MKLIFTLPRVICLLLGSIFAIGVFLSSCVEIPHSPRLVNLEKNKFCQHYQDTSIIDVTKPLNIAVWNIYKLKKVQSRIELNGLLEKNQIILLQEAISSINAIYQQDLHIDQTFAFKMFDEIAGVMTLSKVVPSQACAYSQKEPILRLPKTALLSFFSLSNDKKLAIINNHSINFTYDLMLFKEQLTNILASLKNFDGPIIFAGDFNTWNQSRLSLLKKEFAKLDLQQVTFSPDERSTFLGKPLDHIFYRGLTFNNARSQSTIASDHAWLEASFAFN